jgi:hypothetical protein
MHGATKRSFNIPLLCRYLEYKQTCKTRIHYKTFTITSSMCCRGLDFRKDVHCLCSASTLNAKLFKNRKGRLPKRQIIVQIKILLAIPKKRNERLTCRHIHSSLFCLPHSQELLSRISVRMLSNKHEFRGKRRR